MKVSLAGDAGQKRRIPVKRKSLGEQAMYPSKQVIYNLKGPKKVDFKKKNPFLSRIFVETKQEVL